MTLITLKAEIETHRAVEETKSKAKNTSRNEKSLIFHHWLKHKILN